MKKILKCIEVIFLLIIPIIFLLLSDKMDFFGYVLKIDSENVSKINELLKEEYIDCENPKLIIVESRYKKADIVRIVTKDFEIEKYTNNSESNFIKYIEKNGIDVYDKWNKIKYIYLIIIAIIIFFRKLFENVDMFGKMEERDN